MRAAANALRKSATGHRRDETRAQTSICLLDLPSHPTVSDLPVESRIEREPPRPAGLRMLATQVVHATRHVDTRPYQCRAVTLRQPVRHKNSMKSARLLSSRAAFTASN